MFFLALRPVFGSWPPLSRLRSHTQTHHTLQVSSGRVISPTQRPLPEYTQHSQKIQPCLRWDTNPQTQQASGQRDGQIYIKHSCYTRCYTGAIKTWPVLFYRATQVSQQTSLWRKYSLSPFGRCPCTVRVPYIRTNSREIDCAKMECRKKGTVRGKHGGLEVRVPSFQQRTREDSLLLETWNFSTWS